MKTKAGRHYRVVPKAKSGTPRAKCRKWQLLVQNGRTAKGDISWTTRLFDGTWTAACEEALEWAESIDRREDAPRSRWTFASYAEHWNDAKLATGAIAESTHGKNASFIASLSRHLGPKLMQEVTTEDIESAYAALKRGDSPSGRRLSGTTLSCYATVCWSVFEQAKEAGLVVSNPAEKSLRPRPDTREREALGLAEEAELAVSLNPADPHNLAMIIMSEAGLRQCEFCGDALRWRDIGGGRIHVRRTKQRIGAEDPAGIRTVPCSATLTDALTVGKFACMLRNGTSDVEDLPVLADAHGDGMSAGTLQEWWYRHRSEFGLDGWTLHQFRHTFATNLAEADVHPKKMAALLGHESERTSLRIYTHVHEGDLDDAMRSLDRAKGKN